ncbi:P-loop containing nucleoside triphosphate hydrolase protein [Tribonema minus]|uniref:P-loop containing nucleoside triphosphate hydrolase protein n=1 Tax=Tribonema minus TaxID=303371 RepID=A0A835ZAR9_9STRA|nr:P-loop containing nucleoside triphosphate hydrolase protein [Tribonema minus]
MALGDRELEDVLMERSLRFYDPKLTGEREKAYLVGLEARGYGMSQRDKQRPETYAGLTDEEREEAGAAAARQRRQDWEDRFTLEESLSELSELAGTAGLEVVGSTYQRVVEPNPRTYIGTGKVKEVRRAMRALDCKTVIIDHELSPGQQRSLEAEFGGEEEGIKVLDRTALILDIFAQHARTREGQVQVELALHLYRLPRLTKLWTHLERQSGAAGSGGGKSGGVGLRGPGERQLEVDRRLLKAKITDLQRLLKDVRRHRTIHRRRRESLGLPIVALVGYTNAGKSTVLNYLTSAGVLAEDMLFATLDPTTRRVKLPGLKVHPEIMLTDTVGFIQKLPTNLVAAFRATLEEVSEADVIVHVCDFSNPAWQKQSKAVMQVLRDLDALDGGRVPVVTLWNKLDILPQSEREDVQLMAATEHDMTVAASARSGIGMDDFIAMLEVALGTLLEPVEAVVPYSKGDLLSRVHELGACDFEEYCEGGCFIKARVPDELVNRLEPYFTDDFKKAQTRAAALRLRKGDAAAAALATELDEAQWAAIAKGRHNAVHQQP